MQNNCTAKIVFRTPVQTLISREIKHKAWTNIQNSYYSRA